MCVSCSINCVVLRACAAVVRSCLGETAVEAGDSGGDEVREVGFKRFFFLLAGIQFDQAERRQCDKGTDTS